MIREGEEFFKYKGKSVILDFYDKVASSTSNYYDDIRLKFIWFGTIIKMEHSENKYEDMTREEYLKEIQDFIKLRIDEIWT